MFILLNKQVSVFIIRLRENKNILYFYKIKNIGIPNTLCQVFKREKTLTYKTIFRMKITLLIIIHMTTGT